MRNRRMIKTRMIEVRLMAVWSSAENHQGSEPEQNPKQRARNGEPKGNIPASGAICLHAIFSSVRRATFQKTLVAAQALIASGSAFTQTVKGVAIENGKVRACRARVALSFKPKAETLRRLIRPRLSLPALPTGMGAFQNRGQTIPKPIPRTNKIISTVWINSFCRRGTRCKVSKRKDAG